MDQKIRNALCDMGYEDSIIFDRPDYDDAIIGITAEGSVVYDYNAMVRSLMKRDGISMEEAIDFIDYNTIQSHAYVGEGVPIIMYPLTINGD